MPASDRQRSHTSDRQRTSSSNSWRWRSPIASGPGRTLSLFSVTLVHLLLSSSSPLSEAFVLPPPLGSSSRPPTLRRERLRGASNTASSSRGIGGGDALPTTAVEEFSDVTMAPRPRGGGGNRGSRGSGDGEPNLPSLSITTFNVLAPIFKRVGSGRESEFREDYLQRQRCILDHLRAVGSDIICLQELWVAEPEMVDMYRRSLQGYRMYTLPRTEARGDGVACFVKEGIEVLDRQDLRLKGVGGRVALILRLGIGGGGGGERSEVVVANTHLLFPHARTFQILRIREVKKLLAFVECYTQTNDLAHLPVVLCGDFNGKSAGRVYQHLTQRAFRCSYEDTLEPGVDSSRWITHLNHLGEELGVDYVWYRNPDSRLGPMEPAWESIVYQSTKQQLLGALPNGSRSNSSSGPEKAEGAEEAVSLETAAAAAAEAAAGGAVGGGEVDGENDRLSAACQLLGLSEGFELNEEELKLLLDSSADDFDFLIPTIMDGSSTGLEGASGGARSSPGESLSYPGGCTLETSSSRIWPPSLEEGVWPSDYKISDHGSLTSSFRLVPVPARGEGVTVSAGSGPPAGVPTADFPETLEGTDGRVGGDRTEARDWGGGDDGHYGLR